MRHFSWIAILFLVVMCCVVPDSQADDESAAAIVGGTALSVAVFGTALTSVVVNTVQIARGRGSKFWGWAGILSGIAIPVYLEASTNGEPEGYYAGAAVAALGTWSLLRAINHADAEKRSSLQLGPTLYARNERLEPGIAVTLDF